MPNLRYFFVLLLFVFPDSIYAQSKVQAQIDSLLRAQTDAIHDTNEALLLIKVDSLYNTINPDRGIYYNEQAWKICNDLDWERGYGLVKMNLGLNYKYKAEYKRALPELFTARTFFEKTGAMFDLGDCLKYIGQIYEDQKIFDTALNYYRRSIDIFEKLGNKAMIARNYGNICNAYELMGDNDSTLNSSIFDSSIFYGFKSLKIFEALNEKSYIASCLGNISIAYNSLKNYDSALSFSQRALTMFEELGDKGGIAFNLGNIGDVHLSFAKYSGNSNDTIIKLHLTQAIDYFNRSIAASSDINQVENIMDLQPRLAEAYALNGDYRKAYETHVSFVALKESANKNENITSIAQITSNRELMLLAQEKEIIALKKQFQLTLLIASVIILLIVIAIGVNRYLVQLKSNKILAEEKKVHLEKIEAQATVLSDIAYTQSHDVRGEVATILGLAQIFNFEQPDDPTNKIVIEGIAQVTEKLDAIVKSTIVQENELSGEVRLNPNKNTLG